MRSTTVQYFKRCYAKNILIIILGGRNRSHVALDEWGTGGIFGAGGRFKGGTDPIMEKFNESISFDQR